MTVINEKTPCSFQQVQGLKALQSSIRFLPHIIMGVCVNVAMAFLISRVRIQTLTVASALITMVAPPLMATVEIGQSYWHAPFWALFLSPVNPDGALPPPLSVPGLFLPHVRHAASTEKKKKKKKKHLTSKKFYSQYPTS